VFGLVLLGLLAGCGGDGPQPLKTHAVKGKVVYKDDNQPLTAGTVEFQSTTDPNLNGRGDVDDKGGFVLYTIVGNKKQPGVAEGTYRVTVLPPMGPDQLAQAIDLPGTVVVTADGPNDFTLTIPGRARR
jgi:hypothetical protein